ncbi:VOC family protein [Streptomyces sp. TR06-5]|uniref:VOC family protein n=1 Tax=unclassified Streptomyces TaxID=2593676 RepID=UPI0039A1EAD1
MADINTFLWFDDQAREAAETYVSIFGKGARITGVQHYGEAGPGVPGSVMTVTFELAGQPFTALNGGPEFTFTEAVSLQITCEDQDEVDHFWSCLGEGGQEVQCGWLKDRYGLSWQVVPRRLFELTADPDPVRSQAVFRAMLGMKKLEIAGLEEAYAAAG